MISNRYTTFSAAWPHDKHSIFTDIFMQCIIEIEHFLTTMLIIDEKLLERC